VEFLPYSASGHPFNVDVEGQKYYYFPTPFPLAVRMRVKAQWDDVIDANRYEALTALKPKTSAGRSAPRLDLGGSKSPPHRWVSFAELMGRDPAPGEPNDVSAKTSVIQALEKEKRDVHLVDIESGKEISAHNGTVYFNAYRQRWVTIFVQQFGESSFLGELWYAEADTPVGPWAYTRKIVTHNKYSFYNPKHHPEFDRDGGRILLLEGTYTFTFSGSAENATPRYDYNQIMYRLDLDDPRLALPVAVYQVRDKRGGRDYLLRDGVERARKWDLVESIPFYAIEPARADANMVAVYAVKIPAKTGQKTCCLTVKCPDASARAGPARKISCVGFGKLRRKRPSWTIRLSRSQDDPRFRGGDVIAAKKKVVGQAPPYFRQDNRRVGGRDLIAAKAAIAPQFSPRQMRLLPRNI